MVPQLLVIECESLIKLTLGSNARCFPEEQCDESFSYLFTNCISIVISYEIFDSLLLTRN